jgi:hypothetical protein
MRFVTVKSAEQQGRLMQHRTRRELHGEIARLRATQNAVDVSGGTTPVVYQVN